MNVITSQHTLSNYFHVLHTVIYCAQFMLPLVQQTLQSLGVEVIISSYYT